MNTEKLVGDPFDAVLTEVGQSMIYLNGSKTSFRCDCCCNVFTKLSNGHYRCNGCRTTYATT